MKKNAKRFLIAALAVVMVFSLALTAFAAYDPGYGEGTISEEVIPVSEPIVFAGQISFVEGDTYDLTAKQGTTVMSDGSIVVTLTGTKVPANLVPAVAGADAYYKVTAWAVKDANGNLVPIDIAKYDFTSGTKVYAVTQDVWTPYSDMKADRTDWYYRYVRDLAIAGVVNGMPDGTFAPGAPLTYGQALKLVMLATGYSAQEPTASHWASGYYTTALADKLVDEAGINLDREITRAEVAEIVARALKLGKVTIATPFADTELECALKLYQAGIMEGSFEGAERVFKGDTAITRAEISAIIWRVNNYNAK